MRREKLSKVPEPVFRVKTEEEARTHPVMAWDFPHTRDGDWSSVQGLSCSRAQSAVDWLMAAGFGRVDACCLISDLYWDAYSEFIACGLIKRPKTAGQPIRRATKPRTKKKSGA